MLIVLIPAAKAFFRKSSQTSVTVLLTPAPSVSSTLMALVVFEAEAPKFPTPPDATTVTAIALFSSAAFLRNAS